MAEEAKPRRRRVLRGVLIGVLAVIVLVVAAGAIGWASFDPNAWKPRIAAAVKRATGRDLALTGPLSLMPGLAPTITAENVALANVAGGSRPEMATVQRLRISVALWPLLSHRVVIEGLTLEHPDILLERNAQGVPNWVLRPDVPAQSLPQATPAAAHAPTRVELRALRIVDGRVTWRDRRGHLAAADIPRLDLTAAADTAPAHLAGSLAAHGVPINVSADTGPLAELGEGRPAAPWPVKLSLAGLGGHLDADGTLADPGRLAGYVLNVDAALPDLGQLDRIFPHANLPPVRDVAFSAHLADLGLPGGIPQVSAVKLHLGAADFSRTVPELHLTSLDLSDAAPDQPSQLDLRGQFRTVPVALSGTFGPPEALLGGAKRFRVDLAGKAADATAKAQGTIAAPLAPSGMELEVSANIPDLAGLTPLAGRQLPDLRSVTLQGHLADRPAGFALSGIALSSAEGDLSGQMEWDREGGRRRLRADLASTHLDLDALRAALPAPPPPPPPLQPAPPIAAPAAPAGPARLIPDTRLPLDALRSDDAGGRLTVARLTAGGEEYRNIAATLDLTGGHLTLAPVSADTPGGPAQGALEIQAGGAVPSVGVVLHAPALALAPILAALHQRADASGTVMVDADLHGTGDTTRALAATLDGHLGLAMVNGQVDNALLTRVFGKVLSSAHLPAELAGHTDVRCLALRLDARQGVADVAAFALDTSRLSVTGTGTINLADEALALQLRPLLRLGSNGVAVPVRVGGTLANPQAGLDTMGGGGRVGAVIGSLSGAGQGDSCGPALAAARNGQPGPAPAPQARQGVNAGDLLRLFRSR